MSEHVGPPDEGRPAAGRAREIGPIVEIAVRLGAVLVLVAWCLQIVAPFVGIVLWALIIAIAADGLCDAVAGWLGNRRTLAAALIVAIALLILLVPAALLSDTLITGAHRFSAQVESEGFHVPTPPERIAEWPLVGPRLYAGWKLASDNLAEALGRVAPQLAAVSSWLLRAAGAAGVGLLQLLASLILAGFFLAHSEGRQAGLGRVASRLAGPRGSQFADLAYATVRSVVQGIVGVAVIQALLAGAGLAAAGVPAPGLWALLVLVAAIVQLPVALVLIIPVVIVFSRDSTTVAFAFLAWCAFVALIDNVLKPLMFSRGAKVPTLVIFLGAIGGMLSMGIIGLFLGAVVLSLGYEMLVAWLTEPEESPAVAASS
jgi:predicted PurR-regulated permease PerM